MSDTSTVIAEIVKNSREVLRVNVGPYKGRQLLSIWTWVQAPDGNGMRPTNKGISVRVELLPDLKRAIEKAETTAKEQGLLPNDGCEHV